MCANLFQNVTNFICICSCLGYFGICICLSFSLSPYISHGSSSPNSTLPLSLNFCSPVSLPCLPPSIPSSQDPNVVSVSRIYATDKNKRMRSTLRCTSQFIRVPCARRSTREDRREKKSFDHTLSNCAELENFLLV